MTGNTLKKLILSEGLSVAEVARRLGTSQQNLTCALNKDDIKTGLLERVAEAMNRPLSFFYGEAFGPVQSVGDNNTQVTQVAGNYSNAAPDSDMLQMLKMKDEQLSLAMRQTSKAQEQMDRVLDFLGTHKIGPDKPQGLHFVGSLKDREDDRASHCSDEYYSFVSPIPHGVPNRKTDK